MKLNNIIEEKDKGNLPEIYSVKHLPIVMDFAKRIGIVDIVNRLVPSKMDIDPGTTVLGMALDTLSGRMPLYRLHETFEEYDAELLLGKAVNPNAFEDHNVGRALDKIYEAGSHRIFMEIVRRAINIFNINMRHVSFDTASLNVFGNYSDYSLDTPNAPFAITHGHSKDHRPDLKQFLISLLCVNKNIPIIGKMEDGNGSDKRINNDALSSVSKHMAQYGLEPGSFIYIADSALVTEANLEKMGDDILFISRLPAVYNECGRLIEEAADENNWKDEGILAITKSTANRPAAFYKTYETEVILHGRTYRAVVAHSNSHDRRRQKKIDRELNREHDTLKKIVKKKSKEEFFCEADARQEIEKLKKDTGKYHRIEAEVIEKPKYKRGRPKGGKRELKEMHYGLQIEIEENKAAIERLRELAGCFILISNVPKEFGEGYDPRAILKACKDQHGIEQNFGFLKDPAIVDGIYLNKAERIEALGLILLISLLLWRLIELTMREHIEKTGETLPGWEKRRTERPASFMLMTKFSAIKVIKIGEKRRLSKPLNDQQLEYLNALGVDPLIFIKPGVG